MHKNAPNKNGDVIFVSLLLYYRGSLHDNLIELVHTEDKHL